MSAFNPKAAGNAERLEYVAKIHTLREVMVSSERKQRRVALCAAAALGSAGILLMALAACILLAPDCPVAQGVVAIFSSVAQGGGA